MFFRKNNKSNTKSESKKHTIKDVEASLGKPHPTDERIMMLKAIGFAYQEGIRGAVIDLDKSYDYYNQAAELGDAEALCKAGEVLTIKYAGVDEMHFALGVLKICQSLNNGYQPARNTLQFIVDEKIFDDCNTVEDLFVMMEMPMNF